MRDTETRGWKAQMAEHRRLVTAHPSFKHSREPKRVAFDTEPKGPWMLPDQGGMNREPHRAEKKKGLP